MCLNHFPLLCEIFINVGHGGRYIIIPMFFAFRTMMFCSFIESVYITSTPWLMKWVAIWISKCSCHLKRKNLTSGNFLGMTAYIYKKIRKKNTNTFSVNHSFYSRLHFRTISVSSELISCPGEQCDLFLRDSVLRSCLFVADDSDHVWDIDCICSLYFRAFTCSS